MLQFAASISFAVHLNTNHISAYRKCIGIWNESAGAECARINIGSGANAEDSEEDLVPGLFYS